MTASRQTASYLKNRFAEVGIALNARHGQNFLIDLNLLELLADAAEIQPHDVVLEVGTGTGALTSLIAPRAAAVVTVEIDPRLYQLASEELLDFNNVTMLNQDALKNKNTMHPAVMDAVAAALADGPDRTFKLVANLPYSVATPIISNLLAGALVPETMTVTIQKELADRIISPPSTKDYSSLSIWVQSQCRSELLRVIPRQAFWPRPNVTSAILQIRVDEAPLRARITDRPFFHSFVRGLFLHRRKFLRSVLPSIFKGRLEKADADTILQSQGIATATRAEELDTAAIIRLSDAVQNHLAAQASS